MSFQFSQSLNSSILVVSFGDARTQNRVPATLEYRLKPVPTPENVTLTHHWKTRYGKWKKTVYTYDFNTMTQTNGDSGARRQIRMVCTEILRQNCRVGEQQP